jgi:hypothetical protein
MEAYMPGDEMNNLLGFDWYSTDDWAGSDETQATLAFVQGNVRRGRGVAQPGDFPIGRGDQFV